MLGYIITLCLYLIGLAYVYEENANYHITGAEKVQLWAYMLFWPIVVPWAFIIRWIDRFV